MKRYSKPFEKFVSTAIAKGLLDPSQGTGSLDTAPLWRVALTVKEMAKENANEARNVYSALLLFPSMQQLRYDPSLKKTKRLWGSSEPKYSYFFDVRILVQKLLDDPIPTTEKGLRIRAIVVLRIFGLFRSIDLARSTRKLRTERQPWFLNSRRKQKLRCGWYPIHAILPGKICPQKCISEYLSSTSDYDGNDLFISLTIPRHGISADTIGSLTTGFLSAAGIQDDFTAHATRGASVTALILLGVDPHVIASLGDWQSFDCFRKFYDKCKSALPFTQILVPQQSVQRYAIEGLP